MSLPSKEVKSLKETQVIAPILTSNYSKANVYFDPLSLAIILADFTVLFECLLGQFST